MRDRLISLENITLRVRDRLLLAHTSWEIRNNQHWVVLGPNGAGKSTLVKALTGATPVVQGEIRPSSPALLRRRFACVSFEDHRRLIAREELQEEARCFSGKLDSLLTAGDLVYPAGTEGQPETAARFLRRFHLQHLMKRAVRSLSTGEIRKVLITRALMSRSEAVILDEPFEGLDQASQAGLLEFINQLMSAEKPVVLVTHRLRQVPPNATHVIGLRDGRVLFQGLKRDVLTRVNLKRLHRSGADGLPAMPSPVPAGPQAPGVPLVEFRNVSVRFGSRTVFTAFTWVMQAGENWAVTGPNGSGKTTLLNLIVGDNPQVFANDIRLFGRRRGTGETLTEIRGRIGFISCEFHLAYRRQLCGFDAVLSGFFDSVGLYRRASAVQKETAGRWMQSMGIPELAGREFSRLSSGEQRMVLLARAMVKSPRLLILDEPCQGLDRTNRGRVLRIVELIGRLPSTNLIYVTHHPEELPACITHRLDLPASGAGK